MLGIHKAPALFILLTGIILFTPVSTLFGQCPAEPFIAAATTEICSGDSFSIIASFDVEGMGNSGVFSINSVPTLLLPSILNLDEATNITIPPNTSCDPITYTFTAVATCDNNDDIPPLDPADLQWELTVYPALNEDFYTISEGDCDNATLVTIACDNYILIDPDPLPSIPSGGEVGIDSWGITYNDGPNGIACFDEEVNVNFECLASCPSRPSLSIDKNAICGDEEIQICVDFENLGNGFTADIVVEEGNNLLPPSNILQAGDCYNISLPSHTDCEPIEYQFVLNATCENGSDILGSINAISKKVLVFPDFNNNFLLTTDGDCQTGSTITPICIHYSVTPPPGGSTIPLPGEFGEDTWLISYDYQANPPLVNCFEEVPFLVDYSCNDNCPLDPFIAVDFPDVCGDDLVTISGMFGVNGTLAANFIITETTGLITNITEGEAFSLPINKGCEPVSYTFSAEAICEGNVIPPANSNDMILVVTVFPTFNLNQLDIVEGECGIPTNITSDCPHYDIQAPFGGPTTPNNEEVGEDKWTINYEFNGNSASYTCFIDEIVAVPYNCGSSCPADPVITANFTEICSGDRIRISGFFNTTGSQSGSFQISEQTGIISNILEDRPISFPLNTGCDPQTYTFTATASCDDGTPILGSTDNLVLTVTVYPDYNNNFMNVTEGNCEESGFLSTTCDNYELTTIGGPTLPNPEEAGNDLWEVRYIGGSPDDKICFSPVQVEVPYSCGGFCPSDPFINVDKHTICEGEAIIITGGFNNPGSAGLTGSFTIEDASGTITNIIAGEAFQLPVNETCEVATYVFIASASCSDGSFINSTEILTVSVDVYPSFNASFISSIPGDCGAYGSVSSVCSNYQIIPPPNPVIPTPGQNGNNTWTISYNDGSNNSPCFQDVPFNVPYSCGNNCPTNPKITSNKAFVCSGGQATIIGNFGIVGTGELSGSFEITEATGSITDIQSNQPFLLPSNTTCEPVDYVFTAIATCTDGSPISPVNPSDLNLSITVFPAFNEDFISIEEGTCDKAGSISSICNDYVLTGPTTPTIPAPGINGNDTWIVNYNGNNCFREIVEVFYSCGETCPSNPAINASQVNVCPGDIIQINGGFGNPGTNNLGGSFEIIESTNTIQDIKLNQNITIPENNSCDPITYTFSAITTCDNGSNIPGTSSNSLITTVTVYPDYNPEFITITEGTCGIAGSVTSSCDQYQVLAQDGPTVPSPDTEGNNIWHIEYLTPNANINACFNTQVVTVPYECSGDCPSNPSIESDKIAICSGEMLTITGKFGTPANGNFQGSFAISESTNTLTNIQSGIPFEIPFYDNCDPVQLTFIATATCSNMENIPGTTEDLKIVVDVYPPINEDFLAVDIGTCDVSGMLSSSCPNYLLIPPTELTIPEAGESGTDIWTVRYTNDTNEEVCFEEEISVPYNCEVACPSVPFITSTAREVCGDATITISGEFAIPGTGNFSGSFSISETSGEITNIQDGVPFSLPKNLGCEAETYTFAASAKCSNDSPITGIDPITVTVYPSFNPNLIIREEGRCGIAASIRSDCLNYELNPIGSTTIPGPGQSGNDNWNLTYTGLNQGCFPNQQLQVAYSCGNSCPSQPSISVNEEAICSGGTILIKGVFGQSETGSLNGEFSIREVFDRVTDIENGIAFQVPENNNCEPIPLTFIATPTCSNGTDIFGNPEDLTVSVTVYPSFNPDFVAINTGTCEEAGDINLLCDNYTASIVGNPTIPTPGMSGNDIWTISYDTPDNDNSLCFTPTEINVPYNCGVTCPSSPIIETDNLEVCSGDRIRITASFEEPGLGALGGTISITESSGEITNITSDVPFDLPENNTCTPNVYTFTASALCDDNTIINGDPSKTVLLITVYPSINENLILINPGDCSTAGNIVSVCDNYTTEPVNEPTIPTEGISGNDLWTVSINDDHFCKETQTIQVPYACNVNCPEDPYIKIANTYVCGGDDITITGGFDIIGSDFQGGSFSFTSSDNAIPNIENGTPFTVPINETCFPQTYTITAIATCENGDLILPNQPEDLELTITVFPTFNEGLLSIVLGDCTRAGSVNSLCNNYEVIPPPSITIPQPGESGNDLWKVSYKSEEDVVCIFEEPVLVPFSCDVSCSEEPFIQASSLEVCNGNQLRLSGFFGINGEANTDFFYTDQSGYLSNIKNLETIDLPDNNTCNPIVYKIVATAFCNGQAVEGSPEDMRIDVIHYPSFNVDFISFEPGTCEEAGELVSSCINYQVIPPNNPTIPTNNVSGFDTWTVTYPNSPCFIRQEIEVPYACNVSCPSNPSISIDKNVICSGDEIIIKGLFNDLGDGNLTGSFEFEINNISTSIQNGVPFTLPPNISCDPITYNIKATATCGDGTLINGDEDALFQIVVVYPEYNEEFITNIKGTCGQAGYPTSSCLNYQFEAIGEPTIPPPNSNGTDPWIVYYVDDTGFSCIDHIISVPFSCDNTCPEDPYIEVSQTEVCSGDMITFEGFFRQNAGNSGFFEITELTGRITDINVDEPLILPEVTTCEPEIFTFFARAYCNIDDPINGDPDLMTVNVTVYPAFNEKLIQIENGTCSSKGRVFLGCENYILGDTSNLTLAAPGESGSDLIPIYYDDAGSNTNCFQETIAIPYNCGVSCPTDPRIFITSNQEVCGGDEVIILSEFGTPGSGNLEGSFSLEVLTGDIQEEIFIGQAFTIPPNLTCDPEEIIISATAICSDNTPILVEGTQMTITLIHYPSFNEENLVITQGDCESIGKVSSICTNYSIIPPLNGELPTPNNFVLNNWTINYNDSNACFSNEEVSVIANCNSTCAADPEIYLNTSVACAGDSILINGQFNIEGTGDNLEEINLEETSGLIKNIELGEYFRLPNINNCDPITLTFTATATCQGDTIEGITDKLVQKILVYPNAFDPNAFNFTTGNCSVPSSLNADCSNYQITNPSPIIPNPGESGTDTYTVKYINPDFPDHADICNIKDSLIYIDYSCGSNCASEPNIQTAIWQGNGTMATDKNISIISGDTIVIEGSFNIPSSGSFSESFAIENTFGFSLIENTENRFVLKSNLDNSCNSQTYRFVAEAICFLEDQDSTQIIPAQQVEDLIVEVTVYPQPKATQAANCQLEVVPECEDDLIAIEFFYDNFQDNWLNQGIPYPRNGDSLRWYSTYYYYNESGVLQFQYTSPIETIYASDCPETGCPYPVIVAKEGTLDDNKPESPKSNNGPVILFCFLPDLLNENINLEEVTYQWGYQKVNPDGTSQFIIPDNKNTNFPFYVVNPNQEDVTSLFDYGIEVKIDGCVNSPKVYYHGKVGDEEIPITRKPYWQVFPNPTDEQFTLELFHNDIKGDLHITLYNRLGQIGNYWTLNKQEKLIEKNFKVNDLPAGVYLLEIIHRESGEVWMEKVVIF